MGRHWRWVIGLGFGLAGMTALGAWVWPALAEPYTQEEVVFQHDGRRLAGVLIMPTRRAGKTPCLVFAHGDGPMARDAYGYYRVYWRRFARDGYCSLSWDKPGVGGSEGNWLHQSMDDRAAEVTAAVAFLRARDDVDPRRIGLIGFSQAGWVLPKVAVADPTIAFVISVSGAIDWMEQSAFNARRRLEAEGANPLQIRTELACAGRFDTALRAGVSYEAYLTMHRANLAACGGEPVDADRWRFINLNWRSNARDDLRRTQVPVLAVFGDRDAYVDIDDSIGAYRHDLGPRVRIETFHDADHGLMRATKAKPDHQGLAGLMKILRFELLGEDAFASGYFDLLSRWIGAPPITSDARRLERQRLAG